MSKYLTFYPTPSGFIDVGEAVANKSVPQFSCYATSLHDFLNLVNCGYVVTISFKTFESEIKQVCSNLVDTLQAGLITFDQFTHINVILYKMKLSFIWGSVNV